MQNRDWKFKNNRQNVLKGKVIGKGGEIRYGKVKERETIIVLLTNQLISTSEKGC